MNKNLYDKVVKYMEHRGVKSGYCKIFYNDKDFYFSESKPTLKAVRRLTNADRYIAKNMKTDRIKLCKIISKELVVLFPYEVDI